MNCGQHGHYALLCVRPTAQAKAWQERDAWRRQQMRRWQEYEAIHRRPTSEDPATSGSTGEQEAERIDAPPVALCADMTRRPCRCDRCICPTSDDHGSSPGVGGELGDVTTPSKITTRPPAEDPVLVSPSLEAEFLRNIVQDGDARPEPMGPPEAKGPKQMARERPEGHFRPDPV